MQTETYDVFVIGSGIAGKTVAEACAKEGLSVALAEKRELGGTCANRGCDPKKALMGPTEVWEQSANLHQKGVAKRPKLHWGQLQEFKRTFTDPIPQQTEDDLNEKGIALFRGSPCFVDENTLQMNGKHIKARNVVIATGLVPRKLSIEGKKHLKNSDDFLNLSQLPEHITFLGAGYIAMEFAHMAARAGSRVSILDHGKRPLKHYDTRLVNELVEASGALGISFVFGAKIKTVKKKGERLTVHYTTSEGNKTLQTNMVFNTTGRVPALKQLQLNKGKVSHTEQGIEVDTHLRSTSNPRVFACGDVSRSAKPLSPLAGFEAQIVLKNILDGNHNVSYPHIPTVVFTLPQLAMVGPREKKARKQFPKLKVLQDSVPQWYNNKRIQGKAYAYKVLVDEETDTVVGAQLLGNEAAETINLWTMAVNAKMTTEELKKMIFAYPTWGSDIKAMLG
ncbi:dihydrolipoyl dehydrogenase family protein [Maribacter sp. 2307ULW6-5]|uniref:dihydrolipoyl dehydrogenase family protein n=1 Tax=Maribacter sp. 2307ULW6-5 TaxID=3386275 RepID=UPI0039BD5664